MKFDDNKGDPNSMLIPRDIVARRGQNIYRGGPSNLSGDTTLSEVCGVIEEEKKQPTESTSGISEKETENQKLIEARQKQEEENKKTIEMRARVRDLQDQIRFWESQRGLGSHDDGTINGMVSTLQSQLAGIDGRYW